MGKYIFLLILAGLLGCTKETYVEGIDKAPDPVVPQQNDEPKDMGLFTFQSRWTGDYLALQSQQVITSTSLYQWDLLQLKGSMTYYLKDPSTKRYLSSTSAVTLSLLTQPDASSQWQIEPVDNESFSRIKNVITKGYINFETGTVTCSDVQAGWYSAQWGMKN